MILVKLRLCVLLAGVVMLLSGSIWLPLAHAQTAGRLEEEHRQLEERIRELEAQSNQNAVAVDVLRRDIVELRAIKIESQFARLHAELTFIKNGLYIVSVALLTVIVETGVRILTDFRRDRNNTAPTSNNTGKN